jgi:hypothetical protein
MKLGVGCCWVVMLWLLEEPIEIESKISTLRCCLWGWCVLWCMPHVMKNFDIAFSCAFFSPFLVVRVLVSVPNPTKEGKGQFFGFPHM